MHIISTVCITYIKLECLEITVPLLLDVLRGAEGKHYNYNILTKTFFFLRRSCRWLDPRHNFWPNSNEGSNSSITCTKISLGSLVHSNFLTDNLSFDHWKTGIGSKHAARVAGLPCPDQICCLLCQYQVLNLVCFYPSHINVKLFSNELNIDAFMGVLFQQCTLELDHIRVKSPE